MSKTRVQELLRDIALKLTNQSELYEEASENIINPLLSKTCVHVATVLYALSWAVGETADAKSINPVEEFARLAAEWLGNRRVTTAGDVTLADLAMTDPSSN